MLNLGFLIVIDLTLDYNSTHSLSIVKWFAPRFAFHNFVR